MCALYPNWDPYGTAVYHEPVRRSWLVVPVLDEDTLGRLDSIAPDVVVLDLEDSIHDTKKPAARERFQEAMEAAAISGAEVFVRPDIGLLYADLKAAIWPGLTGVVLPKVSSVEEVVRAEEAMRQIETERGLPEVLELQLCIETAAGNRHADKIIRAAKKIRSVSLGRADLVMDLRPDPLGEIHMMPYLAPAHGLAGPGPWHCPHRGLVGRAVAGNAGKPPSDARGRGARTADWVCGRAVRRPRTGRLPGTRLYALRR